MTIKYQPANKRFILKAINPKIGRGRTSLRNVFTYYRVTQDYINFGIAEEIRGTRRADLTTLNDIMIETLKQRYMFCSVSTSQNKSTGLDVILQRDRWNECNECGKKLWWENKEGTFDNGEITLYKNKSLCKRCYNWAKKNE